jgi:glucose/arabinose dehydrogenase
MKKLLMVVLTLAVLAGVGVMLPLPNGDILVAETNAPPKPEDKQGVRGWAMSIVMSKAGAGGPSANRITLLRDTDGDGKADDKAQGRPVGVAIDKTGALLVADDVGDTI